MDLSAVLPLQPYSEVDETFRVIASRVVDARRRDPASAVVLMMGAHVLREGVQRYLIDLMQRGRVSCIAFNGAGVIHDFELALIGATTESVGRYIKDGRFGLWEETGRINEIVSSANREGLGLGEGVGRFIEEEKLPHRDLSVLAAGHRYGIPVTVHVGIGYDITYEHPNCDASAYGEAGYRDFLILASILESLENGVMMNFGTAVMGPEVYLKALAMARNVARQEGRRISRFTTLVCDIRSLPESYRREASREEPGYYFRPWKTMLVRTVADGGESFYFQGGHRETIPQLWTAIESLSGQTNRA